MSTLPNPNEPIDAFLNLKSRRDLAAFLGIKYNTFVYILYKIPESKKYTNFSLPKRSGGSREISNPIGAIKTIQAKLNLILRDIYEPKETVHGFILNRNIVSNAKQHIRQKYVLNVDLENFFPSIHFGRVRGIFKVYPFKFNEEVATTLAHICCYDKRLPQGAPTSPIISNLICAKLDSEIMQLAKKHRCYYSRYADDLTFSTSVRSFPTAFFELKEIDSGSEIRIGDELAKIINENGFSINTKKTRLSHRYQRQEVTGLTVNLFPNVKRTFLRQVRAMLNAWKKYGLAPAEKEHYEKYNQKYRHMTRKPAFDDILWGKINYVGMVRGKNDDVYLDFCRKFNKLPNGKKSFTIPALKKENDLCPLIMTEGKTDWKHLKAALIALEKQGFHLSTDIRFSEWGDKDRINNTELLKHCDKLSQVPRNYATICMFDRDDDNILKSATVNDQDYKKWENKIFSFAIPVPSHRSDNPKVSIELYYTDDEIRRIDSNGRRLFLSNEFSKKSGIHITEALYCRDSKIRRSALCVVDANDEVFNNKDENVALSKENFADHILNNANNFADFNFFEFKKIFDVIDKIISS